MRRPWLLLPPPCPGRAPGRHPGSMKTHSARAAGAGSGCADGQQSQSLCLLPGRGCHSICGESVPACQDVKYQVSDSVLYTGCR